jgi:hypothetical protein
MDRRGNGPGVSGSAAKLLTKDEARRIAVNIAKLADLWTVERGSRRTAPVGISKSFR